VARREGELTMKKAILLAALAVLALSACEERRRSKPVVPPTDDAPPASDEAPAKAEPETGAFGAAAAAPATPIATAADGVAWPAPNLRAKIVTSKGDILVELYPDAAPKTVVNFVQYAKDGHYDRLIIHRVVPGFVIQGGGYNARFNERATRPPIPYEGDNGLKNYRTTLAMARTADPGSAAAQWYINLRDNNEQLDHFVNDLGPRYGYAVFGRVIDGMAVADAIGALPTGPGGPFEAEVPVETVTIARVDIIE
jgi:peptidyl-prolyl cis-trans isomerase A (cyclophilin A)/peptidyl-prolyl cis-trans isomerase B (cyclophilin B)